MSKTKIITDSGCDIPLDIAKKYSIDIVSLTVRFGKEEVVDTISLSADEFWKKCAETAAVSMPETAAPSPGNFVNAFEKAKADGFDSVVCITLSSKVSSTYESALNALEVVGDSINVTVVDSLSVSIGEGLIAIDAAKAAQNGEPLEKILELTEFNVKNTILMGTIDSLDSLKRTGRISASEALVGSLLSIKPIVELRDGKVEPESRHRTRSKSLDYVIEKATNINNIKLFSILNGAAKDFDTYKTKLLEKVNLPESVEIIYADIGPIIGTHVGRGAVGFACLKNPD
jgi:DegV family protein with EDD domain